MIKQCPICLNKIKQLNPRHIKRCFSDDIDYKIKFINYNFPLTSDKDFLKKSYIDNGDSMNMLCEYVGGLDLKSMTYVLKYYNIDIRSIKETRKSIHYKNRIESTNIEKYGEKNPLSKNTIPYFKRNETIKNKYDVDNVWQCIDLFAKKWKGKSKISKLNKLVYSILEENNIEYTPEFTIKYKNDGKIIWRSYDIKINNILIEINGDYWHANPNKYKKDHIFQFPRIKLTAEDIWNNDNNKKIIATNHGYDVIYLWEEQIKKLTKDEILQFIKNKINQKNKS